MIWDLVRGRVCVYVFYLRIVSSSSRCCWHATTTPPLPFITLERGAAGPPPAVPFGVQPCRRVPPPDDHGHGLHPVPHQPRRHPAVRRPKHS